jgi:predicted aspartyl protease
MKLIFLLFLMSSSSSFGETVGFQLHDGYLIVAKCSVGDLRDLVALVDTGVSETTLDLRVAKRLGLATRPDSATFGTHDAAVQAISIPRIDFGPVHVETLAAITIDLSALTHRLGIRPDVLIGMDLLRQARFVIDYKARTITFDDLPKLGHSAPLIPGMRFALVAAQAESKSLRLQVDTGFNAILVYGDRLHLVARGDMGAHSGTFGRDLSARPGSASQLKIGDWQGRQITVYETDDEPRGNVEFDGLLGPAAIGIHRLAFDFERGMMSWD